MSCDLPTRQEFINRIMDEKKLSSINITPGVLKRIEILVNEADKNGEIKKESI